MDYEGIGKDPRSIPRTLQYIQNTERLGVDVSNIKQIPNWVSKEDCIRIIEAIETECTPTLKCPPQWRDMTYDVADTPEDVRNILSDALARAIDEMSIRFETKVVQSADNWVVVRWPVGSEMGLHADDLGRHEFQMSGIIYFNDDYEGGTITFPKYNLSIKPNAGDLIIFPGNMHYAHRVDRITKGVRYAMTIFGEYK